MKRMILLLLLLSACNGRPNGTLDPVDHNEPPSTEGFGRIQVTVVGGSAGAGYIVTISNGQKRTVGPNETATFTTVRTGTHEIAIAGVPSYCTLAEQNPQVITLRRSETISVGFSVACTSGA